jgi:hypothetical protein
VTKVKVNEGRYIDYNFTHFRHFRHFSFQSKLVRIFKKGEMPEELSPEDDLSFLLK